MHSRSFIFSDMCIQCYKFPSKHSFHCTLQNSVSSIFIFSLSLKYFKISLDTSFWTHMLFGHVLFYLQIFGDFPAIFLLQIFGLIPLWSESMLCMISVLLYLSRCLMAQNVVYFCECSMWTEKNVYSALVRWSIFYTSIRSSWLMVLFNPTISLPIFCLLNLSITERGVLKSPT